MAMKIVQAVGWYFPESIGGSEVYVAGLARYVRDAGCEVIVASPDASATQERTYAFEDARVYRYPVAVPTTRDEWQNRVVTQGGELFQQWLLREKPDIVHFHSFATGLGIFEMRAAKKAGAKVVVTFHQPSLGYICQRGTLMRWGQALCDGECERVKCSACYLHSRGLHPLFAYLVGAMPVAVSKLLRNLPGMLGIVLGIGDLIEYNCSITREMFDIVDNFVFLNKAALEIFAANGARRQKLLLNRLGISHEDIRKKVGPDVHPTQLPIKIGYLGRFDAIKGVYVLAKAFAALPEDLEVSVEFRGPLAHTQSQIVAKELKEIVRYDPRVSFVSAESLDSIPAIAASYDLLVCPSVCFEGGPTVALEAQAAGTPVIGSRIGGLEEIIEDGRNGRLVPVGDWQALVESIVQIVNNPHETIDRWRMNLPRVRTMKEIAQGYLAIYRA